MILITGDCGFIGRHFKRDLHCLCEGYDLFYGMDIRDKYKLELTFEECQPDTVIHLAALTGVRRSVLYPQDYISTNIEGTWNVVKMAEKYGVKNFIFFSSSSVYGNTSPPVKETEPKNPISLYGITKLAGEQIVNSASIPTVIIRPFTVYGEDGRKDQVIMRWITQIQRHKAITLYGDAESIRGYTYVGDIRQVVKTLIDMDWTWEHEDFNLGGAEPIKLGTLIEVFQKMFPKMRIEYKERPKEDVICQYADTAKAKEVLKFMPAPLFEERVRQIIGESLCS